MLAFRCDAGRSCPVCIPNRRGHIPNRIPVCLLLQALPYGKTTQLDEDSIVPQGACFFNFLFPTADLLLSRYWLAVCSATAEAPGAALAVL